MKIQDDAMVEWTGGGLPTFVTHLECSLTGERYPADTLQTLSKAGRPLLVRYDLDGVRRALPRGVLTERPQTLWRYRELLPVRRSENVLSLGEVVTPLIPLPRIGGRLGVGELLVKDEGRLPTGSFKARGLVLAVSMAKELGVTTMAMPGRRWPHTVHAPASRLTFSVPRIPRRSMSARSRCRAPRSFSSTG